MGSGTAPRVARSMWTCPKTGPPTGVPSRTRFSARGSTTNRGRAVPAMRQTGPGERNADGATFDGPRCPCPNAAASNCPCPKINVDEGCLTAVADMKTPAIEWWVIGGSTAYSMGGIARPGEEAKYRP